MLANRLCSHSSLVVALYINTHQVFLVGSVAGSINGPSSADTDGGRFAVVVTATTTTRWLITIMCSVWRIFFFFLNKKSFSTLLSCKINSYLLVNDGVVEIGCVAVDSDVVLVYAYQKAFKKENQHQKSITNMKMVLNRLIDGPPCCVLVLVLFRNCYTAYKRPFRFCDKCSAPAK